VSNDTAVSGIVLAGGVSRRLGRNKAVEPLGGQPLIRRVFDRLAEVTAQTVVVVAGLEQAEVLPLPDSVLVVEDAYPNCGSLGGIFTGLSAAEADWGLVVACDMPFLNYELLAHILSLRGGYDAVVPVLDGRPEPTHAAYSKACLPPIERRLEARELKIAGFFDDVRVRLVPEDEVDRLDPDHLSFLNVNTQEDLERANVLVEAGH
jgi:molybdopterin-guanine dinucleotide biosynthesis protein A